MPEEIVTGEDVVTDDRKVRPSRHQASRSTIPGLEPTPISVYLTLLTSMFMHGGLAHLLGNMLFLWIFGDNVEDDLGHVRYIVFYLVCGLLASLAHVASTYALRTAIRDIPSLGASGAISGVLGGYLLLFPHRRVTVILFRFLTEVPAYVAIGIWFLFQLINGLGMLGDAARRRRRLRRPHRRLHRRTGARQVVRRRPARTRLAHQVRQPSAPADHETAVVNLRYDT